MPSSPFTPLHPTLRACHCGFVGTKTQFYSHMDSWQKLYKDGGLPNFWKDHGEVPINASDPRVRQHELGRKAYDLVTEARQKIIDEL